ncbi:endonuclease/exonuclease/phosphatase family protein [Agromyces lapidis]|uniref:Endonuclease/exonuclease/phosphatase family protein n=1 Tax=Agromyces lapidis TaxID=279574 RepID=A0ABV5SVJ1_9MICO|nr:endonuclease/exonuclease/phosphatase family protein [Agromyces lapidis]
MASASLPAKRALISLVGAGVALTAFLYVPPAHAAGGSLSLDVATIAADETVEITFDAGEAVHERNWIGIYRDGVMPGGPASLDWRYVPEPSGTVSWGPSARDGWTHNTATMGAGDYDVYLLEDDGYGVLAGPIDLTVTGEPTEPTTPPADPKPEVDGVSELDVLAFNVWHGGTQIPNGAQEIADIIRETDADVTFLPEVGQAPAQVAELLGYEHLIATDTGVVSRYPIVSSDTIDRWWTKAVIDVHGTEVVVYGGHLEYRWYTTYLPRGYGGEIHGDWPSGWNTWNKLDAPVTDVEQILAANVQSGRPATAADLVEDIAAERAAGRIAIVGGDFNEPSAQDWTAATADLQDHNGVVVEWQTTQTLLDGGLVDAYREVFPDPVANPGITWPSDNERFPTSSLTWAPEADERDRIDYIFATPDERLAIDDAAVVGPQSSIVRNERVDDDSADEILTPDAVWPSDHKAVLAEFRVCDEGCDDGEPAAPVIELGAGSVAAGATIAISGSGFAPGTELRVELHSTPVLLGTVTADDVGAFQATVTIPADTAPGAHTVVVTGDGDVSASAELTVTAAAGGVETPGGEAPGDGGSGGTDPDAEPAGSASGSESGDLASTGTDVLPVVIGGALLLGSGLVLLLARRRRNGAA